MTIAQLKNETDTVTNTWHNAKAVIVGSRIPSSTELETIRKQKKPLIYLMTTDPIVGDIERFSYATSIPVEHMDFISSCDSIWLTENLKQHMSYVEAIYKRPVKIVPTIWDNSYTSSIEKTYKFKQNDSPLTIIILETNATFNTTGWKQLIICEQLYLKNPASISEVFLFNTPDTNQTCMGMINSLSIKKNGKLRIFKSLPIKDIISFFMDRPNVVFLTNQIFDDLSYNYYDVLNAGFKVVHSSPSLKEADVGYYYNNLDINGAVVHLKNKEYNPESDLIKNRKFLRSMRLADSSIFE